MIIFEINFHTLELKPLTSTAIHIMTTSRIPVAILDKKKATASTAKVLALNDSLPKTHFLLVIKANTIAKNHAMMVEKTFGIQNAL